MTTTLPEARAVTERPGVEWLRGALPKVVLAPSFAITVIFVYGFMIWTGYLSVSESRMMPNYDWAGLEQYRSEEHTSELQSLMRISYAVFCLKKNIPQNKKTLTHN